MKAKIHRMLFESRIGEWLLTQLERWAGLALVDVDQLTGNAPLMD